MSIFSFHLILYIKFLTFFFFVKKNVFFIKQNKKKKTSNEFDSLSCFEMKKCRSNRHRRRSLDCHNSVQCTSTAAFLQFYVFFFDLKPLSDVYIDGLSLNRVVLINICLYMWKKVFKYFQMNLTFPC